jgi:hypothetical protein
VGRDYWTLANTATTEMTMHRAGLKGLGGMTRGAAYR